MENNTENPRSETGRAFFDWLRSTGLRRPEGSWFGGVMAGASEKLGWDVTLLRGIAVVAAILFFSPVALVYGLAWILLPDASGRIHAQEALRGDYSAGLVGGAALAVFGAFNVFTPAHVAGPFAFLVNVAIIAAVVLVVVWLVKGHSSRNAEDGSQDAGAEQSGKGRGGTSSSEADGRPAWFPKDSAPSAAPAASGSAPSGHSAAAPHSTAHSAGQGSAAPADGRSAVETWAEDYAARYAEQHESPEQREERRRRRLVTFGMLLVLVPLIVGISWFTGQIGLSGNGPVLLGFALVVMMLAVVHIIASLRGRRGRGFLLSMTTAAMLVLFAGSQSGWTGPEGGFSSSSGHVFGNYTTQSESVNTAFANTTVDLRHLRAAEGEAVTTHHAEINGAFGNTDVVVPDDTQVQINNGHALGNLNVRTQDDRFRDSGIAGSDHTLSPEDGFDQELILDLNSAFGNITLYDATTYAQEKGEGVPAGAETEERSSEDAEDEAQQTDQEEAR